MRNNEELKQIAIDMRSGQIFSTLHLAAEDQTFMTSSVFAALNFLSPENAKELEEKDATVVFEYMHKAGPMAINGFPIFMSFQYLDREEALAVLSYIGRLDEAEMEVEHSSTSEMLSNDI